MSHHADSNKPVNITINGIPVTVPDGTRILDAAKKANVTIPVLCDHPDLCKRGLCRLCVVECDGMRKLIPACINEVWDGMKIVTKNKRIAKIRRTIIELLLANHPHDCLSCVRSKNCELQTLASGYGVFKFPFTSILQKPPIQIESETIVHEMSKCVKCSRCVEVCQEVQTIRAINTSGRCFNYRISTPYKQSLEDCSCVFCGACVNVCPVGAIQEYDQSAQAQKALDDSAQKTIAQVLPSFAPVLEKAFGFSAGTITAGKMIAAIKMLGFDKVYDAANAVNASNIEISREVQARIADSTAKKPLISGCAEGVKRFIVKFYPDFKDHLTAEKNLRGQFASSFKSTYAKEAGIDLANVTSISFMPCIALKYTTKPDKTDFALTANELARMIKLSGIKIETLPEEQFDTIDFNYNVYYSSIKKITAHGYAQARNIMESLRKGECSADWIEILCCPKGCGVLSDGVTVNK